MTKIDAQDFLETISKTKLFQSKESVCIRTEHKEGFEVEYEDITSITPAYIHTLLDDIPDTTEISLYMDSADDEVIIYIDAR